MDFDEITQTLENIPDFISTSTNDIELFCEDVIEDNDSLDDWSIDDFLNALPKTIENDKGVIYDFYFCYRHKDNSWLAFYDTNTNDHLYETNNINRYECLQNLYFKLKKINII